MSKLSLESDDYFQLDLRFFNFALDHLPDHIDSHLIGSGTYTNNADNVSDSFNYHQRVGKLTENLIWTESWLLRLRPFLG